MDQSTPGDWEAIFTSARAYGAELPDRILAMLRQLEHLKGAYLVTQLTHSLQTADLAERAAASDELILAALCHDIGKVISSRNHAAIAAEILWPFVSEETYQIILHHQEFQGKYFFQYTGGDPDLRMKYANEQWFERAAQFADEWDMMAFDPARKTPPLEHFEPLVRKIFSTARRNRFG